MLELKRLEVSESQCRRIALIEGRRMDAAQREQETAYLAPVSLETATPAPEIQAERLVLSLDAGTVLTVKSEEDKSVWIGRAMDLADCVRKPPADGSQKPGRGLVVRSLFTASAESFEDFQPRMKALAWMGGMRHANQTLVLGDGAPCIWGWAEQSLPEQSVHIQDFWHVAEHLVELCREVWGESAKDSPRLARWRAALRDSQVDRVIAELTAEAKKRRGAKRDLLLKKIGYLERGRHRMDYRRFAEQGWPIGSGNIEASVKGLLKHRLDIAGARWRRKNIGPMLALGVAQFNRAWEASWARPQAPQQLRVA
jgi:hypothetical protein